MDLALKPEADGFTEANGRKGLRDATVFDKAYHQQPDTKEHGPMVCRTATDQKHMQMEVQFSWEFLILGPGYFNEELLTQNRKLPRPMVTRHATWLWCAHFGSFWHGCSV